jgi:hypothetical protein
MLVAVDVRPWVLSLYVLLDVRVLCARATGFRRGEGGWAGGFIFSESIVELGSVGGQCLFIFLPLCLAATSCILRKVFSIES